MRRGRRSEVGDEIAGGKSEVSLVNVLCVG